MNAFVRCQCSGECGVDIPVKLDWTHALRIVDYPSQCPDTKRAIHYPPELSHTELSEAWSDAIAEQLV